ncbi:MAG TPA: glutamine-hydrolyzing carbamoyl-phosphate synthase small subunit [Ktedonobacterales bacterium]
MQTPTQAQLHDMLEDGLLALLALEDGTVFCGHPFGAVEALCRGRRGEVVFNTSMTGYQEVCTDPSYRAQMVLMTYPLIGNYGATPADGESRRPWLSALLVRERCEEYSNWRATETLDRYLARHGIPGMFGLDTRALTRHLRSQGTLRAVLRAYPTGMVPGEEEIAALAAEARRVRSVSQLGVVEEVAKGRISAWRTDARVHPHAARPLWRSVHPGLVACRGAGSTPAAAADISTASPSPRVLLIDTGFKHSIARQLGERGLEVMVAPHTVTLAQVCRLHPDGVLLSNGPGDPENVAHLVKLTRAVLAAGLPLMGICLGHQVLGLAIGATTSRLPFGHHGSNHPVVELRTGRVTLTAQNHGFQVDADSIPTDSGFYVSHVNLSDGSVEGLAHESLPVFSVQFHPEAAPGPQDNRYLFDRFAQLVAHERMALLAG